MKTSVCPTHPANALRERRGRGESALSLLQPTADTPYVAHATLVEMPVLTCSMECMDKPAPQEEIGYVIANPAGACYGAATPYNQSSFEGAARLITLTANPNCGYKFVRWQGTGDVYDVYGDVRTGVSLQAGDNEPALWVTDKTIRIKMAEKNTLWEPKNQYITAVCENKKRALVVEGGPKDRWDSILWGKSVAPSHLNKFGYYVKTLEKENKSIVENNIPDFNVFVYNGHGTVNMLENQRWYGDENNQIVRDRVRQLKMPPINCSFSYKLVYLNCCLAGQEADLWMDAFSSQAFVGWTTSPLGPKALRFDKRFWKYMSQGMRSDKAALTAYLDTQYSLWFYLPTSLCQWRDFITFKGGVRLDECP